MTRESLALISLQSGALLLAIWLIFRLVPSIPANAKAWIWRLALLKPLLSLLPFAVVTLRVLPPETPAVNHILVPVDSVDVAFAAVAEELMPAIDPLLVAWYAGIGLIFGFALVSYWLSARRIQRLAPATHPDLVEWKDLLLTRANIRKPVELLASSRMPSAMLIGGFRKLIVIPEASLAGDLEDVKLMIAHEVAHIARRDLLWLGLGSLTQMIFFFHPAVWLAARSSRLAHESATDEQASRLAGVPIRTYAEMLLRATVIRRPKMVAGTIAMADSYRHIHRRLEAMKYFNEKPTFTRRTATFALAIATLVLLPAYELAAVQPNEFNGLEPQEVQEKRTKAEEKIHLVLPVKVEPDKNGKLRYFIWTKKGYVEIEDDKIPVLVPGKATTLSTAKGTKLQERAIVRTGTKLPVQVLKPANVSSGQPATVGPIPFRAVAGKPGTGAAVPAEKTETIIVGTPKIRDGETVVVGGLKPTKVATQTITLAPQPVKVTTGTLTTAKVITYEGTVTILKSSQVVTTKPAQVAKTLVAQKATDVAGVYQKGLQGLTGTVRISVTPNKIRIIDAEGKTREFEVKPGRTYEFDGKTLKEVKAKSPVSGTTFRLPPQADVYRLAPSNTKLSAKAGSLYRLADPIKLAPKYQKLREKIKNIYKAAPHKDPKDPTTGGGGSSPS